MQSVNIVDLQIILVQITLIYFHEESLNCNLIKKNKIIYIYVFGHIYTVFYTFFYIYNFLIQENKNKQLCIILGQNIILAYKGT